MACRLLATHEQAPDHPRLYEPAATLAAGRLADPDQIIALDQPPEQTRDQIQNALLGDYHAAAPPPLTSTSPDSAGGSAATPTAPCSQPAATTSTTCACARAVSDPVRPRWVDSPSQPGTHRATLRARTSQNP